MTKGNESQFISKNVGGYEPQVLKDRYRPWHYVRAICLMENLVS